MKLEFKLDDSEVDKIQTLVLRGLITSSTQEKQQILEELAAIFNVKNRSNW